MTVRLLTEHYLELISLKRGSTGASESTFVKMPHFWKSHVVDHFISREVVSDRGHVFTPEVYVHGKEYPECRAASHEATS